MKSKVPVFFICFLITLSLTSFSHATVSGDYHISGTVYIPETDQMFLGTLPNALVEIYDKEFIGSKKLDETYTDQWGRFHSRFHYSGEAPDIVLKVSLANPKFKVVQAGTGKLFTFKASTVLYNRPPGDYELVVDLKTVDKDAVVYRDATSVHYHTFAFFDFLDRMGVRTSGYKRLRVAYNSPFTIVPGDDTIYLDDRRDSNSDLNGFFISGFAHEFGHYVTANHPTFGKNRSKYTAIPNFGDPYWGDGKAGHANDSAEYPDTAFFEGFGNFFAQVALRDLSDGTSPNLRFKDVPALWNYFHGWGSNAEHIPHNIAGERNESNIYGTLFDWWDDHNDSNIFFISSTQDHPVANLPHVPWQTSMVAHPDHDFHLTQVYRVLDMASSFAALLAKDSEGRFGVYLVNEAATVRRLVHEFKDEDDFLRDWDDVQRLEGSHIQAYFFGLNLVVRNFSVVNVFNVARPEEDPTLLLGYDHQSDEVSYDLAPSSEYRLRNMVPISNRSGIYFQYQNADRGSPDYQKLATYRWDGGAPILVAARYDGELCATVYNQHCYSFVLSDPEGGSNLIRQNLVTLDSEKLWQEGYTDTPHFGRFEDTQLKFDERELDHAPSIVVKDERIFLKMHDSTGTKGTHYANIYEINLDEEYITRHAGDYVEGHHNDSNLNSTFTKNTAIVSDGSDTYFTYDLDHSGIIRNMRVVEFDPAGERINAICSEDKIHVSFKTIYDALDSTRDEIIPLDSYMRSRYGSGRDYAGVLENNWIMGASTCELLPEDAIETQVPEDAVDRSTSSTAKTIECATEEGDRITTPDLPDSEEDDITFGEVQEVAAEE